MVVKFLVGPSIMIATSLAVGLQGLLLRVAVIQAALPLAVLSFVYAKEYNVHPEIMSTGVILGIFSSVPITILYYIILGIWK
ncbi:putative auxin efflux carrier component 9 [Cocos nucifera]|uniref:Putative auxin efflux carrier component 9 n=1 Tax=Cocos nucifera TaxID=13894 RepID=A0A8K0N0M3_COCNU|nr:putative auxin efflux carrier component 9 [Cocos nucifera]